VTGRVNNEQLKAAIAIYGVIFGSMSDIWLWDLHQLPVSQGRRERTLSVWALGSHIQISERGGAYPRMAFASRVAVEIASDKKAGFVGEAR
jgi:hypothetical protein